MKKLFFFFPPLIHYSALSGLTLGKSSEKIIQDTKGAYSSLAKSKPKLCPLEPTLDFVQNGGEVILKCFSI